MQAMERHASLPPAEQQTAKAAYALQKAEFQFAALYHGFLTAVLMFFQSVPGQVDAGFWSYGLMFGVFAGQFALIALKTRSAKFAAQLEK